MNVYTCEDFTGHYPIGVGVVIVAESQQEAASQLEHALILEGLEQKVQPEQMIIVSTDSVSIRFLSLGNY